MTDLLQFQTNNNGLWWYDKLCLLSRRWTNLSTYRCPNLNWFRTFVVVVIAVVVIVDVVVVVEKGNPSDLLLLKRNWINKRFSLYANFLSAISYISNCQDHPLKEPLLCKGTYPWFYIIFLSFNMRMWYMKAHFCGSYREENF